jgi:hypothetical protein
MLRSIVGISGAAIALLLGACSSGDAATPTGGTTTKAVTTTSSSTSSSAGGAGGGVSEGGASAGGAGGGAHEGGAGGAGAGPFTPAPHGDLPSAVDEGGKVLKKPSVQAIYYAGDGFAADVDGFLQELTTTTFWAETTSEYGVGPLTVKPSITRADAAPKALTDDALVAELQKGLGGDWGKADPSTIYLFVVPNGTSLDSGGLCCQDFDGYHAQASVGGFAVPYAVVCGCPGMDGPGVDDLGQITVAASHELVEAATDPLPNSDPAYGSTDDAHAIWTVITGGELADLCEYDDDAFVRPEGSKYMVQRSWSNAAAKAGHEPCVPSNGTFFQAVPAQTDDVTIDFYGAWKTKGVKVAAGQKRTIDLALFSDDATAPFDVTVYDYSSDYMGGPKRLALSLDQAKGKNGDVLKLTIDALSLDPDTKSATFVVHSQLGDRSSLFFGVVTR